MGHLKKSLIVLAGLICISACSAKQDQDFFTVSNTLSDSMDISPSSIDYNVGSKSLNLVSENIEQAVFTSSEAHEISIKNPVLSNIAETALEVSERISTSASSLEEQHSSARSVMFEMLPSVVPEAQITNDGDPLYRLIAQQVLFDAGRHVGRSRQANARIKIAEIKYWQERNDAVFAALEQYVRILKYSNFLELSEKNLANHIKLRRQIKTRFSGGISDNSEKLLVDVKVLKLKSQVSTDVGELRAAKGLFKSLAGMQAARFGNVSLEGVDKFFSKIDSTKMVPDVKLASYKVDEVKGEYQETKSSGLPRVMLEGFIENRDGSEDEGVMITLNTDAFSGFSYKSKLEASYSRVLSARSSQERAYEEFSRESTQLKQAYNYLLDREKQLTQQVLEARRSVNFFFDQLDAGVKPIVEALRVYEGAFDVSRLLVSTRAEILMNRLNAARLLGALAHYPDV